jgi:phage/plasmid-associated DNA primase
MTPTLAMPTVHRPALATSDAALALNTPAGLVDLRSGRLAAASVGLTEGPCTAVAPQSAPAAAWLALLADSFGTDVLGTATIAYLKRLLGASLLGDDTAPAVPLLYGPAGTGREVVLEVVVRVLGGYALRIREDFLTRKREPSQKEMADLTGRRFVVTGPLPERFLLNRWTLARLARTQVTIARHQRGLALEFPPGIHVWVEAVAAPRVDDPELRQRLDLVPCVNPLPAPLAKDVAGDLAAAEGPRILAWLISGAVQAAREGLLANPGATLPEVSAVPAARAV